MWDKLFSTVDGLGQGLYASARRNEVILNNIANSDTPGFKTSQVRFEDILASVVSSGDNVALKTTRDRHIGGLPATLSEVEPVVVQDDSTSYRMDENNVDIESQMVGLAQNSLSYYTMVNKLNSEFTKLNMAIKGQA